MKVVKAFLTIALSIIAYGAYSDVAISYPLLELFGNQYTPTGMYFTSQEYACKKTIETELEMFQKDSANSSGGTYCGAPVQYAYDTSKAEQCIIGVRMFSAGCPNDPFGYITSQPAYFSGCLDDDVYNPVTYKCERSIDIDNNFGDQPCANVRNPINVSNGNKFQAESDYVGFGKNSLTLVRYYNSRLNILINSGLGKAWTHSYSSRVERYQAAMYELVTIRRPDGSAMTFIGTFLNNVYPDIRTTYINGTYTGGSYYVDPQKGIVNTAQRSIKDPFIASTFVFTNIGNSSLSMLDPATNNGARWRFTNDQRVAEFFDSDGLPILTNYPNGEVIVYTYVNKLLSEVSDNRGHKLSFSYNASGQLEKVTDPAGGAIAYSYNSDSMLNQVTYQDQNKKQYLYEKSNSPTLLTGIIDENNSRFATYDYDNDSKMAIRTEHAGGVNSATILYGDQVQITNANGGTLIRTYTHVRGKALPLSQDVSGAGCMNTNALSEYDDMGNLTKTTDYNGVSTSYVYKTGTNYETSRTEAVGYPEQKIINTTWNESVRLPATISEPGRKTTYVYDNAGNVLSKKIEAGTLSRTYQWTYGSLSNATSYTDPNGNKTSFTYDSQGNLQSISNAANQVTQFLAYDLHGHPTSIKDPNGTIVTLAYSSRGWLKNRTVGTESTLFDYDSVGQLVKVTFPAGHSVQYSYDAAHRLVAISDSAGNQIRYTLDLMGNKLKEEIADPTGLLAATIKEIDRYRQFPLLSPAQAA